MAARACWWHTADGRHWFVFEGVDLARRGGAVLLAATEFPAHGDPAAGERAVSTGVLTQRRALDVLTAGRRGPDPTALLRAQRGARQGAVLAAVEPHPDGLVLVSVGSGTIARLAADTLGADEASCSPRNAVPAGAIFTYGRTYTLRRCR